MVYRGRNFYVVPPHLTVITVRSVTIQKYSLLCNGRTRVAYYFNQESSAPAPKSIPTATLYQLSSPADFLQAVFAVYLLLVFAFIFAFDIHFTHFFEFVNDKFLKKSNLYCQKIY